MLTYLTSETPSEPTRVQRKKRLTKYEEKRVAQYYARNKSAMYCSYKTGFSIYAVKRVYERCRARDAKPRLSPAIIKALLAKHNSWKPIAEKLQRSIKALSSYCYRYKIDTGLRKKLLTRAEKTKITQLWSWGFTHKQIGKRLGRSHHTVRNYLRKRNVHTDKRYTNKSRSSVFSNQSNCG